MRYQLDGGRSRAYLDDSHVVLAGGHAGVLESVAIALLELRDVTRAVANHVVDDPRAVAKRPLALEPGLGVEDRLDGCLEGGVSWPEVVDSGVTTFSISPSRTVTAAVDEHSEFELVDRRVDDRDVDPDTAGLRRLVEPGVLRRRGYVAVGTFGVIAKPRPVVVYAIEQVLALNVVIASVPANLIERRRELHPEFAGAVHTVVDDSVVFTALEVAGRRCPPEQADESVEM